ncbi:MAG: response regulator [Candidatus Omnitrophica bacterium]|nr:response regulator [Candidatus Omnitrophota bacterium]
MRPRILIVDDEADIRETFADFIQKRLDCVIDLKANGVEAILALEAEEYHVLLLDLQMPGVDGFEVLARAMALRPGMIILVMSRLDDPVREKKIEDTGAVYITKPASLKAVLACIERKLAERR